MTTPKVEETDKYTKKMQEAVDASKKSPMRASIKETYNNYVLKHPILISRELVVDNHVVLGVEYDEEGKPVRTFATDENGKKISITNIADNQDYKDYGLSDMIAKRIDQLQNFTSKDVAKTKETPQTVDNRKVKRTEVSKETAELVKNRGQAKI